MCLAPNASIQVPKVYQTFCEASNRNDLTKSLIADMQMMLTYDSEMFCYMLPCIFSDFAHSESFSVVNNCELIRMVTTAVDPMSLHEFMCLCLTGSAKIISREDPMSVIGKCQIIMDVLCIYSQVGSLTLIQSYPQNQV